MKLGWMAALGVAMAIGCTSQQAAMKAEPATTAAKAEESHTGMQPPLEDASGATKAFDHKPKPGEKAICAVSGEPFVVTEETKTAEVDGKWYAFCCDQCEPDFKANPGKYTN